MKLFKKKVGICDKDLVKQFLNITSFIGVICTFLLMFFTIPEEYKNLKGAIIFTVILVLIYIGIWIRANTVKRVELSINNSVFEIKEGDIFEESSLKVIGFNEYFDTKVDNKIISDKTLNGIYIKKCVDDLLKLDLDIEKDKHLGKNKDSINANRVEGKKQKYILGSIFKNEKYLLTAFSKFDDDNRAYLLMKDYIDFLIKFWDEIDIIYNGESVSIPLMGSGITRFKEYSLSDQELLELLIWSFKISRNKFTYPSKVSIIIHSSKIDKINLYKLKRGNYGI